MAISFKEFLWRSMTAAINGIKPAPRLLQDIIFKARNSNPSDTIDVDIVVGGKQMVPFVSPVEGGTVVAKAGQSMKSVKTPRLRPKKPFTAQELLLERAPGGTFYASGAGDITAARNQKLVTELDLLRNGIDTTIEYLCGQALTGAVTVTQENLAFQVDYAMPAANKPVNGTGAKWTDSTGDPLADSQAFTDIIQAATGQGPDVCVMGSSAAAAFLNKVAGSKWFDATHLQAGGFNWKADTAYLGNGLGVDYYRCATQVTDTSGNAVSIVAPDKAIYVNTRARITIEFGLILDLEAGAQVIGEYFAKSWIEKDPSVLWMLAESRPLPVLWQPDAVVYADVV